MTVSPIQFAEAEIEAIPVLLAEPGTEVLAPPARSGGPSLIARAATGIANLIVDGTLMTAGAMVGSQVGMRLTARTHPGPMPRHYSSLLDHPARLVYRKPDELLGLAGVFAGMKILDLGCGSGLYTAEAARAAGTDGLVYAVDVQKSMTELTHERLSAAGIRDRCVLHTAGAYALPLENQSVDLALIVATLGEIPDRLHALLELFRVVRSGGRIVISEEAPHPGYLTARSVRHAAEEAGFVFVARNGSPFCFTSVFARP